MKVNHLFDGLMDARVASDKSVIQVAGGRNWSYAQLIALSGQLAQLLVDSGVKPGDRVAVQALKSVEVLALYLATIRVGAAFLPLNTAYTRSEIDYFINDAEPTVFVVSPGNDSEFSAELRVFTLDGAGQGSVIDACKSLSPDFANVARGAEDLAAILYTSGTTGLSKGAMLSHGNLLSNTQVLVEYWHFDENDVLLHALPIFHTHGLFVACNVIFMANASMIFLPKFDPELVLQELPNATTMMGVPTFYTRLLASDAFTRERVAHMRLFTSGSAPMLAETHIQFEQRTGQRILERYGMTETNMNTSNPYSGDRRAGTVGVALPGIQVRVVDVENGKPLDDDSIGMIEVCGPNLFLGYWCKPEKTAEDMRDDGFFITGDLGRFDIDGYLHIVGRNKDLIISGGYNIYPKEIETEIDLLVGVVESAVFAITDPDLGEKVAAAVVLESANAWDEKTLVASLESKLARFKHPRRVIFVDELPRNTMGKVQKNQLRETYR
ncbi:MAG: malonyl-CoA/methylmalonyl-CoA synthetase [Planctomycetota bacterium]|jgi:malonyl-CoA/methylmalonyl-CoA synthetase